MSEIETNKIVGSILVSGLIIVAINVLVDEALRETGLEKPVYPVPARESVEAAVTKAEAAPELRLGALLAQADVEKGKKVAKKCKACHDVKQGGPNKVGPNLWGIVGASKASKDGFAYSGALGGLGGEWTYDALDAFLKRPKEYAPGTKMAFAGLKKPTDRANLIAYLRTLGDNPPPLPPAD